ncbi:RNA dependent RNA polymerase-domain-containing protein [Dichotomopilus funicola]|uniref:RNA-dependent RNA polymerase n=1 Tax=Dichotomopilus funicola TaxID=1934379 RepID=A0AAN6UU64_9PEZI|nr:RNA dependent RNA polymerase-domain-containing protein [Dichotomopilus funicola]
MEVRLANLPRQWTDSILRNQLQPYLDELAIKDFAVEKQRNRPMGHITFLHHSHGVKFLQHHGEKPINELSFQQTQQQKQQQQRKKQGGRKYPPAKAQLKLVGQSIYCRLSDRKPDEFALKSIQHEIEARANSVREPVETPNKAFEASRLSLSCGYYSFRDTKLVFTPEWLSYVGWTVKFTNRSLTLSTNGAETQARIPFQSIVELVWWHDGKATVTLSSPPIFLVWDKDQQNHRRKESLSEPHRQISPYCLVYQFQVPVSVTRQGLNDFQKEMGRLGDKGFFPVTRFEIGHQSRPDIPIDQGARSLRDQLNQYSQVKALPFDLLFLLQALMTNGYLHPMTILALAGTLVRYFAEHRDKGDGGQPPISTDTFRKLFDWIDYPTPFGDPSMYEVDGIMEYLKQSEVKLRQSSALRAQLLGATPNRARIFRAVVTPTRVTLHGPELEPMNRVLRKFPDHSFFVRAQFCDENGQDLFLNARVSLDEIYERFKSILITGVPVAGRVYKLLGFSHSSLRAHSAWLSAPFFFQGQVQLPQRIISGLGDFSKITSPARRAARIGQAFSETPWAVDLIECGSTTVYIPDVERNNYVFSDGVGTMSLGAAAAAYDIIPESKGFPTCFQIRWAGAKGMLSVDPSLPGVQICIRPSMVKFESNETRQLEICDTAKPMPMVLNQQIIKILEDMGAPSDWFLQLQSEELRRLRGIAATVYNTSSFLRSQKIGESIQLYKFLRQTEDMGIDYRRDNFLRGAVEVVLLRELRLLKAKARIPVRNGMTLFGIMDETGFLKEGEVYVTFDTEDGRHQAPPGPGKLLVARSPALHPGDIQLAVNRLPPKHHPLAQQRNCIIFSQKGARDLPGQLSGGDLDGDVFHILWDREVVGAVKTFPPAEYPRVGPEVKEPEPGDIEAFFVDFMRTDHLGVIANRHKILADQRKDGTLDADCIKLAGLHSSAVDFSKTGRPVKMSDLPKNPAWRPDFLASSPSITIHDKSEIELDDHMAPRDDDNDDDEGPRHKFYRSEKLLGQLYRNVDERKIWAEDVKMAGWDKGPSFWSRLLEALDQRTARLGRVVRWKHRLEVARQLLHIYEDVIYGAMIDFADQPHQPLRELEVFVGFILNGSGIQSNRQRDRSVKLRDEFERISALVTREMRHPAPIAGSVVGELDGLEMCIACLFVGCDKKEVDSQKFRNSPKNIESFKIVAAAALMRELTAAESRSQIGRGYGLGGGGYVGVGGVKLAVHSKSFKK